MRMAWYALKVSDREQLWCQETQYTQALGCAGPLRPRSWLPRSLQLRMVQSRIQIILLWRHRFGDLPCHVDAPILAR
jgi:hypothetical protein